MSSELQLLMRIRQDLHLLVDKYLESLSANVQPKSAVKVQKPADPAPAPKMTAVKPVDQPLPDASKGDNPSEAKGQPEAKPAATAKPAPAEKLSDLQMFFKEISQQI